MAETKEVTLTDLAEEHAKLSDMLKRYTAARNYLWRIANNEMNPPVITISPTPLDMKLGVNDAWAVIETVTMPQDALDNIIITALHHQEAKAFDTWQKLAENALSAVAIIDRLKKQRDEASKSELDVTEQVVLKYPGDK